MTRLVFLLEERSMAILLEGLLPRLYPDIPFICIKHEGKQDLERSIPRKLRSWDEPGARFIILRDNDGADCIRLKARLKELCDQGRRPSALVRIVCQELEAWYIGEPLAMARAFGQPDLARIGRRAAFRDPDKVTQPSSRLVELVPSFQKLSGARAMSMELSKEGNISRSFQVFIEGLERELKASGESSLD